MWPCVYSVYKKPLHNSKMFAKLQIPWVVWGLLVSLPLNFEKYIFECRRIVFKTTLKMAFAQK
jgi:hypothetical protein